MIEITRSLARTVRAVMKKSTPRHANRNSHVAVTFVTDEDGLRVQAIQGDIAVEYRQPGPLKADKIVVAAEALADFEGRKQEIVTLAAVENRVQVRWFDGNVPQTKEYPIPDIDKLPDFPDEATVWSDPGPNFLNAMADAFQCVGRDAGRFALTHLQLRGKAGEIHATDGRQALIQSGFRFDFKDDILVPGIPVFGSSELPADEPVVIGRPIPASASASAPGRSSLAFIGRADSPMWQASSHPPGNL